VILSAS